LRTNWRPQQVLVESEAYKLRMDGFSQIWVGRKLLFYRETGILKIEGISNEVCYLVWLSEEYIGIELKEYENKR